MAVSALLVINPLTAEEAKKFNPGGNYSACSPALRGLGRRR